MNKLCSKWGKISALLLLLVFVLAVAAGCGNSQGTKQETSQKQEGDTKTEVKEPVKIGGLFAITGGAASLGKPERDTALMLADQLNAAGGIDGHPIDMIVYDTESDPTKGLLAAKKLVEEDGVSVVIGPSTSGVTMALVPYFTEQEVPLVSAAAAAAIVEPVAERKWIFKTPQSDELMFRAIVKYLEGHNLKRIGFISEATGYGDSGRAELEKKDQASDKIEVVAWEKFNQADRDMTAQLTNIRNAKPDVIIAWSIPPAASVVQQNIFDMNLDLPVIQSHGIGNMQFIEVAGKAADGVIFPVGKLPVAEMLPDNDPQKETLVKYKKDFEAKYTYTPSTFGGHAWDAFMMAAKALESGARTPAEIRDFLETSIKDFVGISGVFNYSTETHNGLDLNAVTWVKIENGQWTPLKD